MNDEPKNAPQDIEATKALFAQIFDRPAPDQFDRIASYIDGAIRIIYNSNRQVFNEIFGEENGPYLFAKYTEHFGKNEAEFICYLDHNNQRLLAIAVAEYVETNDPLRAPKDKTK